MDFDLLASIELTACAAAAIAALAIGFGDNAAVRLRIAIALSAWFALVVALGATEALTYPQGLGAPGLGMALALPIVVLVTLVMRKPDIRRRLESVPLSLLIGVNAIRSFGAVFVLLYAAGRLPAPFAPAAGWGDIAIGLTAVPLAWMTHVYGKTMDRVVGVWNGLGLLDLIVAVVLGVLSSPGPQQLIFAAPGAGIMTSLPWLLIPAFLVPLLASTHLAILHRMRSPRGVYVGTKVQAADGTRAG